MPTQPESQRVSHQSMNVVAQPLAELGKLFPAAFTEGKINFAKLRQLLGDEVAEGAERFGLAWSGKSAADEQGGGRQDWRANVLRRGGRDAGDLSGAQLARKPKGVICLDTAFAGNDQLKTNIVLEMKSHQIEFHTA